MTSFLNSIEELIELKGDKAYAQHIVELDTYIELTEQIMNSKWEAPESDDDWGNCESPKSWESFMCNITEDIEVAISGYYTIVDDVYGQSGNSTSEYAISCNIPDDDPSYKTTAGSFLPLKVYCSIGFNYNSGKVSYLTFDVYHCEDSEIQSSALCNKRCGKTLCSDCILKED